MQPQTFVGCLNSFVPFSPSKCGGINYSDITAIHDCSVVMSSILQLILISAVLIIVLAIGFHFQHLWFPAQHFVPVHDLVACLVIYKLIFRTHNNIIVIQFHTTIAAFYLLNSQRIPHYSVGECIKVYRHYLLLIKLLN